MRTLYQNPPPDLPQDLKVTIHNSSLVFPSQETERKTMFLSNIDQVLTFDVQTVHFFPAHKDFPPPVITAKIKESLEKILVHYEFLAGRLKTNIDNGRLEIECSGAGAGFVVASSEYSLDEIGNLVYPNPAFSQLVSSTSMDMTLFKPDDPLLCILQVTTFNCGGFAMGFTTNHVTFDGLSFKLFLQNLASVAADKPLAITPCHDRRLLAARSPPRVNFPHPELLKLPPTSLGQLDPNPTVFKATDEDLVFKIFRLSPDDISTLKERAKSGSEDRVITNFNAVTAFIWRCKALSYDASNNMERQSTILYAVDIRRRVDPPLPQSYTGNAVLTAYARGYCKELEEGPFSKIVDMVAEGARRMTDEYARSAIDWGELYKGFPNGEVLVSSWWRLGFAEVEYPWGKPKYSCPVACHRKDIILFFADLFEDDDRDKERDVRNGKEGSHRERKDGVNILLALPAKEMEKFETLFCKFLFG